MLTLLRHSLDILRSRLSLSPERGEISWGVIIAGVILLVAMYQFQEQIGAAVQWMLDAILDAIRTAFKDTTGNGTSPSGSPTPTATPKRADG